MERKKRVVTRHNQATLIVSPVTSEQIRAARALLRWEQKDLAEHTSISLPTIKRIETTPGPIKALDVTVSGLLSAFRKRGIEFINDPPGTLGVAQTNNNKM